MSLFRKFYIYTTTIATVGGVPDESFTVQVSNDETRDTPVGEIQKSVIKRRETRSRGDQE